MPAPDNGSIQIFRASLTTREQRELGRAERTIARGLKSFLAVGMALKKIRDKKLYRQKYCGCLLSEWERYREPEPCR